MSSENIRLARNLAIAFAGGLLTFGRAAFAQYPLQQSPAAPNPYNWNTFHSGGLDDPAAGTSGGTVYPGSVNGDTGNLLGTSTGLVPITGPTGNIYDIRTIFPSFLLGNVDGLNPLDPDLTGTTNSAVPFRWYNFHQSDTGGNYVYEWFAPFVYQAGALGSQNIVTTDDSNTAFFTTLSGTWTQTTSGSAVDGEYQYVTAPTAVTATASNKVQWKIHNATAGTYYVSAHIPAVGSGVTLSKDAHYTISYLDGNSAAQTANVRAVQATGSITLLGPVSMATNQDILVTLDDSTAQAYTTAPEIIADAVSLVPTTTTQTIDDTSATYTPNAASWQKITATIADAGLKSIVNTATNDNYHRIRAVSGAASKATANVQWTFTIPSSGFYQASFHIPNLEQSIPAGATREYRVTDAHYVIFRSYTSGGTTTKLTETDTRITQTDTSSDQPIGTTFYAATGDTIAVALDNSSGTIQTSQASQTYIVADSITLTPTTGADAEGAAVAVVGDPGNSTGAGTDDPRAYNAVSAPNGTKDLNAYPEIADAFYYGPLPGTVSDIDTAAHGYPAVGTPPADNAHKIRTLVYFGRRETGVTSSGSTFSRGTIYCVDGMTGSVVWMFNTPQLDHTSANATAWPDGDTSVISTPVVARFNVCVGTNASGARLYATKLCVVVADNDGRVYCLDAIGNRDGTGLSPNNTDPTHNHDGFTINYDNNGGLVGNSSAGVTPTTGGLVGTTTAYWIFRPDPTQPKYLYGPNQWGVKPASQYDPNSDMPVPGAFNTASPTIYIDTTKAVDLTTTQPGKSGTTALGENAVIYIGNSNGVLYALDASGGVLADTDPNAVTSGSGANVDKYYKTLPLLIKDPTDPTGNTVLTDRVMTTNCRWWYSLRGPVPSPLNNASSLLARSALRSHYTTVTRAHGDLRAAILANYAASSARAKAQAAKMAARAGKSGAKTAAAAKRSPAKAAAAKRSPAKAAAAKRAQPNARVAAAKPADDTTSQTSNADIESAPAIYVNPADPTEVTVIFGSAHEQEATSNVGRIYAINDSIAGAAGWNGPIGNSGLGDTSGSASPALGPGYPDYNIDQIETWAFPQLHSQDASGKWQTDVRDALGNITGSPVVYFNSVGTGPNHGTFVYFAANSGPEIEPGNSGPAVRPADGTTGRIWCINPTRQADPTAQMKWAYPAAINPNIKVGTGASVEEAAEPSSPIGAFLRATPAVGPVTYPIHIQYVSGGTVTEWQHSDNSNTSITGNAAPVTVPMLYVGCAGSLDNGFYAIDLNGTLNGATGTAADDASRFIYRVDSPNAADFQSSVALITNSYSNTTPYTGPGGMVYCSAGGSLFQFSATPLSNGNNADGTATQAFPQVTVDSFNGFGPVSSASLAGEDVSDIGGATAPNYTVEDWLFAGDTSSGFMHAITPRPHSGVGYGVDVGGYLSDIPPGVAPTQQMTLREALHVHISDNNTNGTPNHRDATSKNIYANENHIGDPLPMFEWGDTAYIRITNVVPPNPGDTDSTKRITQLASEDSLPSGYYLTNGSPISFQISDYDFNGNFSGTNDGGVINNVLDPNITNTAKAIDLNFNGFSMRSDSATATSDPLLNATNKGYFAAFPYALGDGTGRMNTPGARRKIINARQTAEIHAGDGSLVGTVTLESTYVVTGTTVVQQPTFGILNPLAEIGGGVPLDQASGTIAGDSLIGPWLNVASGTGVPNAPWAANPSTFTALNVHNLALTNGNGYIGTQGSPAESQLPKNGDDGVVTAGADPTKPPSGTGGATSTQPTGYDYVFTATGLINHNGSGDNGNGSDWGLRVYDRSDLYTAGRQVSISMERSALHWYDKALYTGPGAVVNALPWDIMPVSWNAGSNTSVDYPDIRRGNVSYTLDPNGLSADIGSTQGGVQITQPNTASPQQYANLPVEVGVNVPQYQPANLSLYTSSSLTNTGVTDRYPDGYHSRVRVYVDTNRNGRWDTGEAYRDVDLQSGVPVDMGTSLVESTADVGAEAHGFGVQTSGYSPLSAFTPFSSAYATSFVPLTVHNDGNVNLKNVLFDQRLLKQDYQGIQTNDTLYMQSDSTDDLSTIPAYDMLGVTGTDSVASSSKNFLIRTSLDADLLTAYGATPPTSGGSPLLNPGFSGAGFASPGFTFHKARVGDNGPTTLTVPDVPHDNSAFAGSSFYVANPVKPEVGVAVPFGTPEGSYSQLIRVFEGIDPINVAGGSRYDPLSPPTYSTDRKWLDVWQASAGDNYRPVQPTSTSGTVVKVRVTESRVTNGASFGTLPQLDAAPVAGAANYNPVAFRDAFWPDSSAMAGTGGLALYFTGTRTGLPGPDVFGYRLPFTSPGYVPSTASAWWSTVGNADGSLFTSPATPTGYNNLTVAQPQDYYDRKNDVFTTFGATTTYAFYTVVTGGNGTPYSTTLECQPVTTGSNALGALTGTPIPVVTGATAIYHPRAVLWNGTPWVFWYAGGKGGARIYYSYEDNTGGSVQFTPPAVLPVPASISQVADPSPVVGSQFMEVSYSGVDPAGHGNIYVSRYTQYLPANSKTYQLALGAPAPISEYLQPDTSNNWWYARDTGWLRNNALDIQVKFGTGYRSLIANTTPAPVPQFDPGSGLLVYSNLTNPLGGTVSAYVDLAGGRIRFYPKLPSGESVFATFQPQARKITTDESRSSVDPISFIDDSFQSNGVGNQVPTSRYWFIFRKSSPGGVNKSPTVFFKTQRLMVAVSDATTGKPVSFPIDSKGMPQITVVATTAGGPVTLFDGSNGGGCVDVDWQRGRVYLPQVWYDPTDATRAVATEGLPVTIHSLTGSFPDWVETVHWADELTGSDPTTPATSISGNASTNEREVPIYNAVNEGEISAFLDPFAYANCLNHVYTVPGVTTNLATGQEVPHTVWLFWSSTRNGASDIYSMPINPNFSISSP